MDGQRSRDRAAEKRKIMEMIRDTVRTLIQNTVAYHTKLSVEALFGITIDDGEESIIFSIHETIGDDKDKAYHYHTEEQHKKPVSDASYPSYDLQDTVSNSQFYNSAAYSQQYKPAVVEKETSVMSYNVGHSDAFLPNTMASNQTASQYFSHDESYSGCRNTDYWYHSAVDVDRRMLVPPGPQRVADRGPVLKHGPRQNVTRERNLITVKQDHGSEVDTTVGGKTRSANAGEVSSEYTCQRCGKQMKRLKKRSYRGNIYRCDGCGKSFSQPAARWLQQEFKKN